MSSFIERKIWKNRKPVDSIEYIHDILNNAFKNVFNKKLRSESIFCVGDRHYASSFGNVFIIFPTDDFNVYWSDIINDIASPIWLYDTTITNEKNEDILAFLVIRCLTYRHPPKKVDTIMDDFISKLDKIPDINSDILNMNIKYKTKIAEEIEFLNPNCATEFVNKYYQKGNLTSAIKSDNELMITGSKYYAISENSNLIKTLLQ